MFIESKLTERGLVVLDFRSVTMSCVGCPNLDNRLISISTVRTWCIVENGLHLRIYVQCQILGRLEVPSAGIESKPVTRRLANSVIPLLVNTVGSLLVQRTVRSSVTQLTTSLVVVDVGFEALVNIGVCRSIVALHDF